MRRIAFVSILLTAGCTGVDRPAEQQPAPSAPTPAPATPGVPKPAAPGVPSPSRPAPPEKPLGTTDARPAASPKAPTITVTPVPAKAPASAVAKGSTSAPPPAVAKGPTAAPSGAAAAAAPAAASAAAAPKADTGPHLDLTTLEKRLRDTKAIGTFTKLALKNEVDDLLDRFRAYYQGKLRTTLNDLRPPFELLMMKVLSLLQNDDPTLASEIARSRESIWGILADKNKFATIT